MSVADATIDHMLTVKQKMTLDLQRTRFKYAGSLDVEIRDLFDEHTASYFQRLNWLVDNSPEAEEYAPEVVHRQRRVRAARQAVRSRHRVA